MTECVRCDDCERLYEDTKKCPHHLISSGKPTSSRGEWRGTAIESGASVGGSSTTSRPFSPDETSTSLLVVTITPSTSGSLSISAIPCSGPSTNTPVESPSATVAFLATIVTLRAAARRLTGVGIEDVVVAPAVAA